MTTKELEKSVMEMDFLPGLRSLKTEESLLRQRVRDTLVTIRQCTETTFSDPTGESGLDAILEDIREMRRLALTYCRIKKILRQKYDKQLRKGKRGKGFITRRYGGINYLFPNV